MYSLLDASSNRLLKLILHLHSLLNGQELRVASTSIDIFLPLRLELLVFLIEISWDVHLSRFYFCLCLLLLIWVLLSAAEAQPLRPHVIASC